ncbi:Putative phosphonates transport system permease protein phnE [Fibrisoma limi BUZ 3]|uniref:Putative phosphonates transport system permease protein phnE n=1 Tax=Fibrisoma limi BUZ 3 TaxID=1185876 RepID=I2GCE7_9BACT|nr:phosphonate ABC transporter, permease protein PhnE [Fibrisoma limi]CCH51571.1 Putative phosphonates transport system permease protein phnE [Fibrisoma limi BUZ 3]
MKQNVSWTYSSYRRKQTLRNWTVMLATFFCAYWAGISCKVDLDALRAGIPKGIEFISYLFPPDWTAFADMAMPALETILLAFLATVLGAFLSLFFGLAASSNIAPRWLRNLSRFLLATERSLPEIVILLLLISALGLGPFPGVIAMAFGCIGMLGRLFSDAIEEINPATLESIESVGARKLQVIAYGVLPQVLPSLLSNTIFRFEVNIRLSVLLGAVGAGGIGFQLYYSFQTLQYQRATTAILITLLLVFLSERLSNSIRKKLSQEAKL